MKNIANDIKNKISTIDNLIKYCHIYNYTNKFHYEYYSISNNVISIDVKSFNLNFLIFINNYIKSENLKSFIQELSESNKNIRLVKFGLLFKELNLIEVNIKDYMIGFRNLIFYKFLKLLSVSNRNIILHRINIDDIEFTILNNFDYNANLFVNDKFLNIIKFKKIDHVITLNKSDGVYYVTDNKIIDIKYTSGWVNIPVYKILLNEIINFIINKNITIKELNIKLREIIEYTPNSHIFGYEDCSISKRYEPTEHISANIKNLFIANTINKFVMLFNRM